MKKGMVLAAAAITAMLPFMTGCSAYPVSVSPASHYIAAKDKVTRIGPASGSAWAACPLGICGGEMKMTGNAVDRAIASVGGDALIDVRVDVHVYNLMVVLIIQTNVYGTAVKIEKGG